jgi:hypothetical protein
MSNHRKLFWEDRLKRGENFVTNKVMKISEALGGELPLGWSPFVKSYLEGNLNIELWFTLTSMKSNSCDFLAILKSATSVDSDRAPKHSLAHPSSVWQPIGLRNQCWTESRSLMDSQHEDRAPVFVIIPEAIENPERMRVWVVPSLVWLVGLETLNEVYCSLREAIERFHPIGKISALLTDRKVQVIQDFLGAARKAAKLPNQVIQY